MQLDGDLIRRHRVTLGMTQAQLAKKSGYDTRTIQRAEAGTPVLNQAAATIAQALEVSLDRIIPRQENLFELPQADQKPEVILLPCPSGKELHRHLNKTDFLTIERDFEPRAEHRAAVKQLGALIDEVWEDPMAPKWPNPTQEEIFEQMIVAGEAIEELGKLGLRLMLGVYTVQQLPITYDEFGDFNGFADNGSYCDYSSLIVCLTDDVEPTLRRKPDDHYLSAKSIAEREAELSRRYDTEIPF